MYRFHLFDKVYLEHDGSIDKMRDRVVISATNGFAPAATEDEEGTVHYYGLNLAEIIGTPDTCPFSNAADFFKTLKETSDSTGKGITIYTDKINGIYVFSCWMKMLFDNLSSDNAWRIFSNFIDKTAYGNFLYYEDFNLGQYTKEDFVSAYDSVITSQDKTWVQTNIGSMSLELLLATYVNDKTNTTIKNALKDVLFKFVKRSCIGVAYDAKETIIRQAHNTTFKTNLGLSNIEKIDDVFNDSTLSILNGSLWNNTLERLTHDSTTQFNIDAITSADATAIIAAINAVSNAMPRGSIDYINTDYFNWVASGSISDDNLVSLLADTSLTAVQLSGEEDFESINVHFFDYVLGLEQSSNVTSIQDIQIALPA